MVHGMPGNFDGCAIQREVDDRLATPDLPKAIEEQMRHLIQDRGIDPYKAFQMVNDDLQAIFARYVETCNTEAQMALVKIRKERGEK